MFKNYVRMAWRSLRSHKGYTAIHILGLSLGICACLVIFLLVHYELGFDRSIPDRDRVFQLVVETKTNNGISETAAAIPPMTGPTLRQEVPGLEQVAAYHWYTATIRVPQTNRHFDNTVDGQDRPSTIITDTSWFAIFPARWLAGNAAALSQPSRVVLTESKMQQYFGPIDPTQAMGRTLLFNDSLQVTVAGIIKDSKDLSDFPFSEFISFSTIGTSFLRQTIDLAHWGTSEIPWTSRALLKLRKETDLVATQKALAALLNKRLERKEWVKSCTLQIEPLSEVHFNTHVSDGVRKAHLSTLYFLMGIAAFILLLAIINFINLSTALAIRRTREIGIRKVLGSSRKGLQIQFLTETVIVVFMAALLSTLLVRPVLAAFQSFIPAGLSFHVDSAIIIFLLLLCGMTSLLAGFLPARMLSSVLPVLSLKGGALLPGSDKAWLRKGLIVFQFTISLIFIFGTLVIARQNAYMRHEDLGFSTDAILSIDTHDYNNTKNIILLEQRIRAIPGVQATARQSFDPIIPMHVEMHLKYKEKDIKEQSVALQIADSDFISLYQIKLLAGKNIRNVDSLKEVLINETLCHQLGFAHPRDAVGKSLYMGDKPQPILGVVNDFHEHSYHEPIQPLMMGHVSQPETGIAIKLASRGKDAASIQPVLKKIEKEWKALFPQPFVYSFLDDSIAQLYETERRTAILMNTAMSIAIFISCMGLFGLSLFTVRQKTKEIGIRKVLGATVTHITILLGRNFLLLILLAFVIASPIAWWVMHRWLEDFAYRIPLSAGLFIKAGLAALLVGLLTVIFQSVRAAMANPVESLRAE